MPIGSTSEKKLILNRGSFIIWHISFNIIVLVAWTVEAIPVFFLLRMTITSMTELLIAIYSQTHI